MSTKEFKSGFELWGWAMAAAAALVFFGVGMLGMGLGFMQAAFVAVVIFVIVGLLTGMPRTEPVTFDTLRADAFAAKVRAADAAAAAAKAPAPKAAAAMPAAAMAMPLMAGEPAAVADLPAGGPERLTAPRNGKADDLKEIEGIGPSMEKLCNEMGFFHYEQIANWSDADIEWVDANMKSFKGRIVRDKWVAQAKLIMAEGLEAFRIRAKTNDY
ncbi:MAG: hypothetical protein JXR75_03035 [Rhodobacteraceae bacterium]|nr:hypothetical protein [Paracoccaceae bacterium]